MKIEALKVRWTMTRAESGMVCDAMLFVSETTAPVAEKVATAYKLLENSMKKNKSADALFFVELNSDEAKEITAHLIMMHEWMIDATKRGDEIEMSDEYSDALIGLVAQLKS